MPARCFRFAAIGRGWACAGVLVSLLLLPCISSCRAISGTLRDAEFHTSPALAQATELQSMLGPAFRLHHIDHFILITDAKGRGAAAVLDTLNELHEDFYAHASAIGLNPEPLRDRLLCVMFEHRADYERYLAEIEGDGTDWSSGHYSHEANVVVLHHDRESPALARIYGSPETKPAEMTPALAAVAELATRHKTRHEAAHQLLYNTGVLVRGQPYPAWIDEGLATLFETTPTESNPFRLAIYRRMKGEGSLLSLKELVEADLTVMRQETIGRYYTQAWAFTFFLWSRHPELLREYLEALRADPVLELQQEFRLFMDELEGA